MRSGLLLLLGIIALARPGLAAVEPVAGLARPLGNTGVSARAVGMGSAYVGVAEGSTALFWNPAGLSGLREIELALHHNSWLAGIIQETAVLGLPLGALGGFGLSMNYINYGVFPGYDSMGNRVSDYSANRYGVGAGWGLELVPKFSIGASLEGTTQTLSESTYTDLAVDVGLLWAPIHGLRLGLAYANLGTSVAGYSLAQSLRAGASCRFELAGVNSLLLAASASFEPQGVNRLNVGVEDLCYSLLALRVGYQADLADDQVEGLTGLSAGLGVQVRALSVDYAYQPFGDLGASQRISVGYQFGQAPQKKRGARKG